MQIMVSAFTLQHFVEVHVARLRNELWDMCFEADTFRVMDDNCKLQRVDKTPGHLLLHLLK